MHGTETISVQQEKKLWSTINIQVDERKAGARRDESQPNAPTSKSGSQNLALLGKPELMEKLIKLSDGRD